MIPDPDLLVILRAIETLGAQSTWYTLGRRVIGHLSSPAALTPALARLRQDGYVIEEAVEGQPLPRLVLTTKASAALADQAPGP